MENAAVQNIIVNSVPGGAPASSQQEKATDGVGFASFLAVERQRAGQASSHSESPSATASQDGSPSNQLDGAGPGTSSTTPNPEGQKTKDTNPSLPSDNELIVEQPSINGNIISSQMAGVVEYFTSPTVTPEQIIPGDSAMTDVPGTGSTIISMPGYSLAPVNTGATQIPVPNPQMIAVGGVQENVTLLNQPTGEPIVQTAVIGQPEPQNLTIQPNVVPGNNAGESIIPQAAAATEIPGMAQQASPVGLAAQNLPSAESNSPNVDPSAVTQWTKAVGVTDDATGISPAPNITPQAADTQAGIQIPQTLAASAPDVGKATVPDQQLPTEPRMTGVAPSERLVDHTAPALPDIPQAKEGNIINFNRTVDVQQIATRADNVENTSVKISASPSTVVLDRGVEAHGNEQLPNPANSGASPQAEPAAVMVSNVEITGKPLQEGMPIVESAGAERRPEAARDIPVARQYVQETQIPSDQINRQQVVITEMTTAENVGSKMYERLATADQKPEAGGDTPVQRQDIPQTQEQSNMAYRPRVISDQVSRQQNVATEIPITGNTVSETYEKVVTIEQKLPVLEDIPARQDIPETQKQSPAISKPRVASGQTVMQQNPQAMDKAPMPNTLEKETSITVNAGALGGTERAQETWRANTAAARPDAVRNIENGGSNRETSVQYVQGTAGMQSFGSEERETSGGNTPQNVEELINNIINPRTPAFDGSQFMIPRMNAESMPLNLEAGTGKLTANAETQMTSTLPELSDKISAYVNDMDVRNGDGSISIQLEPKNLGKIRFRVSLKDNKVSAELSVSLLQTKAIIELQLPEIRRSLAQQAIEVTELSVTLENGSLDSDTRHPNLFREHSNSFRQTSPSVFYDQEEELGEFLQSDARSNALVDLLI